MDEKVLYKNDIDLYHAARRVIEQATRSGVRIGTAESLTGGLVASCLTAVPGSSAVVRGSVVSYAIWVKRHVLGVDQNIFDDPTLGVVSAACAAQMAEGARRVLDCDLAISLTGIAGPGGGEPGKPVGTVWMGVATPQQTKTVLSTFSGGRSEVRQSCAVRALELLYEGVVDISQQR